MQKKIQQFCYAPTFGQKSIAVNLASSKLREKLQMLVMNGNKFPSKLRITGHLIFENAQKHKIYCVALAISDL